MNDILKLTKLVRHHILTSTTKAGSGHPTSSLSAVELMTTLMFGGFFRFDLENPQYINNDRLIFSKGHASPLFYSLWAAAAQDGFYALKSEELETLRKFGSRLEGHPTLLFPYTEVPTGSLGQGLSVGLGMALNAKMENLHYKTFVLLGDSEVAEGSVWEAASLAAHYRLNNLIAILDVNRLGQRGETMFGHDTENYKKKFEAFGWGVITVDGHDIDEIKNAFTSALGVKDRPVVLVAKTLKGKGISFLEDREGWHGKALSMEELERALKELEPVDITVFGEVERPEKVESLKKEKINLKFTTYKSEEKIATRKAYGNMLANLVEANPDVVVLDAETSNSTYAEFVKKKNPERFFEMYIAEQNMVGASLGFSRRGKVPFVSTFAAFFSRAFDQIRMSQYSDANIKFCGSHAGVSIGEDGASQMALEDIAMFRTVLGGVVLYPSDAVSTEKLLLESYKHKGNVYIRTTRKETDILYTTDEDFPIGGSKTLKSSERDVATVVAAGITLHEALKAWEILQKDGINIRVIDLYSIKPLDVDALKKAADETKHIITVEDHFLEGGLGEAVSSASGNLCKVSHLAVQKTPKSGTPDELLEYEEINSNAIQYAVKNILKSF